MLFTFSPRFLPGSVLTALIISLRLAYDKTVSSIFPLKLQFLKTIFQIQPKFAPPPSSIEYIPMKLGVINLLV